MASGYEVWIVDVRCGEWVWGVDVGCGVCIVDRVVRGCSGSLTSE